MIHVGNIPYTGKSKIDFLKKCLLLGLNPRPLDDHSYAFPTGLSTYVLDRRFLK